MLPTVLILPCVPTPRAGGVPPSTTRYRHFFVPTAQSGCEKVPARLKSYTGTIVIQVPSGREGGKEGPNSDSRPPLPRTSSPFMGTDQGTMDHEPVSCLCSLGLLSGLSSRRGRGAKGEMRRSEGSSAPAGEWETLSQPKNGRRSHSNGPSSQSGTLFAPRKDMNAPLFSRASVSQSPWARTSRSTVDAKSQQLRTGLNSEGATASGCVVLGRADSKEDEEDDAPPPPVRASTTS